MQMDTDSQGKRCADLFSEKPLSKRLKSSDENGHDKVEDKPISSGTPSDEKSEPPVKICLIDRIPHIFDVDQLHRLQTRHRISGKMVGPCVGNSHQTDIFGLPCLLLQEEAQLAVEKGFAILVDESKREYPDDYADQQKKFEEESFRKQRLASKYQKLENTKLHIDQILKGKKKKLLKQGRTDEANALTEEMVLKEMEENIQPLPDEKLLILTHYIHPLKNNLPPPVTSWDFPKTSNEVLRYTVYKDLWEKGFWITGGENFGGDFLVYPFDHVACHAPYIIRCCEPDQEISLEDFSAINRVATSTKKQLVLAYVAQDKTVVYQVFKWSPLKI